MYFEWRFGTFVLSAGGVPIVAKQKPASHGGDDTPTTGCAATVTNTGLATCVREASAAPAAYLKRRCRRLRHRRTALIQQGPFLEKQNQELTQQ